MEFENEKKTEELSTEQQSQNHESGYQGYRPGRSPRPRIQKPRPAQYGQQGGYNRNQEQEEGGFRPEGFGAGLMSGAPQRQQGYRPRNNYNNEGGYLSGTGLRHLHHCRHVRAQYLRHLLER